MKITNQEITIQLIDKKGKIKKEIIKRNRVLNNYLNFINYMMFGNTLNTKSQSQYDDMQEKSRTGIMKYCFIKLDSAVVWDDTSTSMSFDFKVIGSTSFGTVPDGDIDISENEVSMIWRYETVIDSAYNGKDIYNIGFGQSNTSIGYWLHAIVDTDSSFTLATDDTLLVTRKDYVTTDGVFSQVSSAMDYPWHINLARKPAYAVPGVTLTINAKMHSISFSEEDDGSNIKKTYLIEDLIVEVPTVYTVGTTEITGFGQFTGFNGTLFYPDTDIYPSTSLYPVGKQWKSVIIRYEAMGTATAPAEPVGARLFYDQIYELADLVTGTYDNQDMKIVLKYERGIL